MATTYDLVSPNLGVVLTELRLRKALATDMRIVTMKMPEGLVEILDEVARENGISRSELVRQAVIYYLTSRKKEYLVEPVKKVVIG